MDTIFGKSFYPLTMPIFLFGIAFALLFHINSIPEFIIDVLDFLPYVIAGIGILLAWWFDSSRAVFALAMIVLGYAMLWLCFPDGLEDDVFGRVGFSAYCFFLPLNLLVFSFLKERGILTFYGRMRIGAILLQFLLIAIIITGGFGQLDAKSTLSIQQTTSDWLNIKIFPFNVQTLLPHISLIAFLFVLIVFFIKAAITCKPMDSSFLGAVIAAAAGLHFVENGSGAAIFFCLAAFMLISAVIQDSYRMAFIDELTELYGRRALMNDMKKLGSKYSIAMGDIDFFKKFNDTHGHNIGDQVLRMVASNLEKVKGGGKAYRYGGEEFTILFPEKSAKDTVEHLEEVRKNIEKACFVLRGKDRPKAKPKKPSQKSASENKPLKITISIGVAEKNTRGDLPEDVIKNADKALYKAKDKGRNCVWVNK